MIDIFHYHDIRIKMSAYIHLSNLFLFNEHFWAYVPLALRKINIINSYRSSNWFKTYPCSI